MENTETEVVIVSSHSYSATLDELLSYQEKTGFLTEKQNKVLQKIAAGRMTPNGSHSQVMAMIIKYQKLTDFGRNID